MNGIAGRFRWSRVRATATFFRSCLKKPSQMPIEIWDEATPFRALRLGLSTLQDQRWQGKKLVTNSSPRIGPLGSVVRADQFRPLVAMEVDRLHLRRRLSRELQGCCSLRPVLPQSISQTSPSVTRQVCSRTHPISGRGSANGPIWSLAMRPGGL